MPLFLKPKPCQPCMLVLVGSCYCMVLLLVLWYSLRTRRTRPAQPSYYYYYYHPDAQPRGPLLLISIDGYQPILMIGSPIICRLLVLVVTVIQPDVPTEKKKEGEMMTPSSGLPLGGRSDCPLESRPTDLPLSTMMYDCEIAALCSPNNLRHSLSSRGGILIFSHRSKLTGKLLEYHT